MGCDSYDGVCPASNVTQPEHVEQATGEAEDGLVERLADVTHKINGGK